MALDAQGSNGKEPIMPHLVVEARCLEPTEPAVQGHIGPLGQKRWPAQEPLQDVHLVCLRTNGLLVAVAAHPRVEDIEERATGGAGGHKVLGGLAHFLEPCRPIPWPKWEVHAEGTQNDHMPEAPLLACCLHIIPLSVEDIRQQQHSQAGMVLEETGHSHVGGGL
eukprot:7084998-Lingulodinium_polyedra.AAC.1